MWFSGHISHTDMSEVPLKQMDLVLVCKVLLLRGNIVQHCMLQILQGTSLACPEP